MHDRAPELRQPAETGGGEALWYPASRPLRGRLMVGRLTLDQVVGVRVPAPQPHETPANRTVPASSADSERESGRSGVHPDLHLLRVAAASPPTDRRLTDHCLGGRRGIAASDCSFEALHRLVAVGAETL